MNLNLKKIIVTYLSTYLSAVVVILFLLSLLIVLLDFEYIGDIQSEIKLNETHLTELESDLLDTDFNEVFNEVLYISDVISDYNLFDTANQTKIAKEWEYFLNRSGNYDQIRFIDKDGMEIIRVNYKEDGAYTVAKKDLQDKSERYYFQESIGLPESEIYVSDLDLNVENEEIETPIKPMVRFAKPIYSGNDLQGILILNYLAETTLNKFFELGQTSHGETYLLNSNGYWMQTTDGNQKWAFMYEDKLNQSFAIKYKYEWNKIKDGEKGQINTPTGLFSYKAFKFDTDRYDLEGNSILGPQFKIITFVRNTSSTSKFLEEDTIKTILIVFKEKYYIYLFLGLVFISLSFLIIRDSKNRKELNFYQNHDYMTKALNRSKGEELIDELLEKAKEDRKSSIVWFVDIRGVKNVNEKFGNEIGDDLIIKVSEGIKYHLSEDQKIARYAGDEFIVILPDTTEKQSELLWKKIIGSFNKLNNEDETPYEIKLTKGDLNLKDTELSTGESIILEARKNMEKEKKDE